MRLSRHAGSAEASNSIYTKIAIFLIFAALILFVAFLIFPREIQGAIMSVIMTYLSYRKGYFKRLFIGEDQAPRLVVPAQKTPRRAGGPSRGRRQTRCGTDPGDVSAARPRNDGPEDPSGDRDDIVIGRHADPVLD